VDIDRFVQLNDPLWRRLGQLSRQGSRSLRRLSDDEVTELVGLYQRVSAQLSHARTQYGDPDLNARLSQLLGQTRMVIYKKRGNPLHSFSRFITETFPAAVWHSRRFVLAAFALFLLPALGFGFWLANSPAVLNAAIPVELQQSIADTEFESYYSSDAAQNFAGTVTINNIQVAFLAFALGVIPILGPAWILANNAVNVGAMAAVMHRAGEGPQFWGLILPHGLLEIASIIIAGAAGLRLSWALIAPADRTRAQAFREEGMRAVVMVMGLVGCFIMAGFIEGFVTPSGLPTSLRIAVGACVLAAFVSYVVLLGMRAENKGLTGLLGEQSRDELAQAQAEANKGTVVSVR